MNESFFERLVIEQSQLHEKLAKLGAFFKTQGFYNLDQWDRETLLAQADAMIKYNEILLTRINRLKNQ